jgi:hypothetical protein
MTLDPISDGDAIDAIISIIETPGEQATDSECLELINDVLTTWKASNS